MSVKYITDGNGKQSAVVVPLKEWVQINKKYERLKNKLKVITGIKDAINEVKEIRKQKKKGKSLSQFLDEN